MVSFVLTPFFPRAVVRYTKYTLKYLRKKKIIETGRPLPPAESRLWGGGVAPDRTLLRSCFSFRFFFFFCRPGDQHVQQPDGDGVGCDRRPVPVPGVHARIRRGERRGDGAGEERARDRQPARPARHALGHGAPGVRGRVRAGRRPHRLVVSGHGDRHAQRPELLLGKWLPRFPRRRRASVSNQRVMLAGDRWPISISETHARA